MASTSKGITDNNPITVETSGTTNKNISRKPLFQFLTYLCQIENCFPKLGADKMELKEISKITYL